MMIQVSLSALEDCGCNPFKGPWFAGTKPLTRQEVASALLNKEFEDFPVKVNAKRNKHIRRIAYLVHQGWLDAIEIDVGCPSFPGYPHKDIVDDGHHRLAAAFYQGNATIGAHIAGEIEYAAELLRIPIEVFQHDV